MHAQRGDATCQRAVLEGEQVVGRVDVYEQIIIQQLSGVFLSGFAGSVRAVSGIG